MIQPFESASYEQELSACEGALTEKECLEALKDMGTEKTPGTDGSLTKFYKLLWKYPPFLSEH